MRIASRAKRLCLRTLRSGVTAAHLSGVSKCNSQEFKAGSSITFQLPPTSARLPPRLQAPARLAHLRKRIGSRDAHSMFVAEGRVVTPSLSRRRASLAELGYRTLVMTSIQRTIGGSLNLNAWLFRTTKTAEPLRVRKRLWIQEVNIQKKIKKQVARIWSYIAAVTNSGLSEIRGGRRKADLPGDGGIDGVLLGTFNDGPKKSATTRLSLDCAPTGGEPSFLVECPPQ